MNLIRLTFLCCMLFIRHLTDVKCYSQLAHDISTPGDNVDIDKSVSLRQKHMEYQLEKSISSHDQGETPKELYKNHRRRRSHHRRHQSEQKKRELGKHTRRQANDFNPFEMDYVDFGAVIGQNGAFSWHANYSPDKRR